MHLKTFPSYSATLTWPTTNQVWRKNLYFWTFSKKNSLRGGVLPPSWGHLVKNCHCIVIPWTLGIRLHEFMTLTIQNVCQYQLLNALLEIELKLQSWRCSLFNYVFNHVDKKNFNTCTRCWLDKRFSIGKAFFNRNFEHIKKACLNKTKRMKE